VDPPEVAFGLDPSDLDPGRGIARISRRSVEVDPEASESAYVRESMGSHQRRAGSVRVGDGRVQHSNGQASEPLGCASLHPVKERRTDPDSPVPRMHHAPRLELALSVRWHERVGDDRAVGIRNHPAVLGELDPGQRPLIADGVVVEVGLADVGEVVREQRRGHAVEIMERGWP
jgi:hypothetical protein